MITVSEIDAPRKKSNNRRVYFVEIDESISVPAGVLKLHEIKVGATFSDLDSLLAKLAEGQYKLAKARALRMLGRSDKTTYEVRKKLLEDGYNFDVSEQVISFLKEYHLCDDQAYVEQFVQSRLNQGIAPRKIQAQLRSKGLSEDHVASMIEELQSDETNEILFEKGLHLIKRYRVEDASERNKALRRLVYRGYSFELAKSIVNHLQERS